MSPDPRYVIEKLNQTADKLEELKVTLGPHSHPLFEEDLEDGQLWHELKQLLEQYEKFESNKSMTVKEAADTAKQFRDLADRIDKKYPIP